MTALSNFILLTRTIFWLFLIFITYKFLAPSAHSGIHIPHIDKLAHFTVFALLTGLAFYGYKLTVKVQLLVWTTYGIAIEFLQGLTATRSPEFLDFVADMLGVIVTLLILQKITTINTDAKAHEQE